MADRLPASSEALAPSNMHPVLKFVYNYRVHAATLDQATAVDPSEPLATANDAYFRNLDTLRRDYETNFWYLDYLKDLFKDRYLGPLFSLEWQIDHAIRSIEDTEPDFSFGDKSWPQYAKIAQWRRAADTAEALIACAAEYCAINDVLAADGSEPRTIEDLTLDDVARINALTSGINQPETVGFHLTRPAEITEPSMAFLPDPASLTDYQRAALDFANYRESVVIALINRELVERFADRFGKDVISGQPILRSPTLPRDYAEAKARTIALPSRLQRWANNGIGGPLPDELVGLSDEQIMRARFPRMADVASVIWGTLEYSDVYIAFEGALKAYEQALADPTAADFDVRTAVETVHTTRISALRDAAADSLLALKAYLSKHIRATFEPATMRLHPDVETDARRLAVYALTMDEGVLIPQAGTAYAIIRDHRNRPLSDSLPDLHRLTISQGLDLRPLIRALVDIAEQQGLSIANVASYLNLLHLLRTRNPREFMEELGSSYGDIALQTFFDLSTADNRGNLPGSRYYGRSAYDLEQPHIVATGRPRNDAEIAKIIAALQNPALYFSGPNWRSF